MKTNYIFWVVMGVMWVTTAAAQKSKRTDAILYLREGRIDEALKAITDASEHPSTVEDPKTWHYKAKIYLQAATDTTRTDAEQLTLTGYEAVVKALQIDRKGRYEEDNQRLLFQAAFLILNHALDHYNQAITHIQDSAKSAAHFQQTIFLLEKFFESRDKIRQPQALDANLARSKLTIPLLHFYAAYSAHKVGDLSAAEKHYPMAINEKVTEAVAFLDYADLLAAKGDLEGASKVLAQGQALFPDEKALMDKEIQLYEQAGQTEALIARLEKLVAQEPDDVRYPIYLAGIYEKQKKTDQAIALYKKALEKDPDHELALYNLGILYYNQGAESYNQSLAERDQKKSDHYLKQAKEWFAKAEPYLEKAYRKNPEDQYLNRALKKIYLLLGKTEKLKSLK